MPQSNGIARLVDVLEDEKAYYVVMERAGGLLRPRNHPKTMKRRPKTVEHHRKHAKNCKKKKKQEKAEK